MIDKKYGFTLIELSIVLIIIGLIIGGIFVGNELIRTSALRADIREIQKFDAAALTFITKYNCKPGDCPSANSLFDSTYHFCSGGSCNFYGNGNGSLSIWQDVYSASESNLAIEHLTLAGLITTERSPDLGFGTYIHVPLKLRAGNCYFMPTNQKTISGAITGKNIIWLGVNPISGVTPWSNVSGQVKASSGSPCYTTSDAYFLDSKLDDGKPRSGNIYINATLYYDYQLHRNLAPNESYNWGSDGKICAREWPTYDDYNISNNSARCSISIVTNF